MKIRFPIILRTGGINDDLTQFDQEQTDVEKAYAVVELDQIESWYSSGAFTIVTMKSNNEFEVDMEEEIFTTLYSKMTLEGIGEVEIKLDEND